MCIAQFRGCADSLWTGSEIIYDMPSSPMPAIGARTNDRATIVPRERTVRMTELIITL